MFKSASVCEDFGIVKCRGGGLSVVRKVRGKFRGEIIRGYGSYEISFTYLQFILRIKFANGLFDYFDYL